MKTFLSQMVLLGATATMLALFMLTIGSDNQETLLSVAAIVIILLAVLAERLVPFRHQWNENDGALIGDITLFVLIFGVLDSALKFGAPFLVLLALGNWSFGTSSLPLWQQAILAGLLIEFGAYVSHFLHHKNRILWPLHAMHHSPERLYTLNNFRFHPLNHIINYFMMILPALLLGLSTTSILAYTAVTMPVLLVQHSNIDFRFGWMNSIINTNELHRWHHSNREHEGNANFGRATVIWDRLFGTYYFSKEARAPKALGLFSGSSTFPKARHLMSQLAYPFTRECCATSR